MTCTTSVVNLWYIEKFWGQIPNFLFNFQGAVGSQLTSDRLELYDIAVNEIVVGSTAEVQAPISFSNLFLGDPDVGQRLSRRGVTEHLLE